MHKPSLNRNTKDTLNVNRGGTGLSELPNEGQILVGTGLSEYVLGSIIAGEQIVITWDGENFIVDAITREWDWVPLAGEEPKMIAVPLTNGSPTNPQILYDANGEMIMYYTQDGTEPEIYYDNDGTVIMIQEVV